MRIHTKHLEISGITRIVINRVIVWQKEQTICTDEPLEVWRKTEGGPGFENNHGPATCKTPEEFMRMIARLLDRQIVIRKWQGHDVCTEQYRAWVSGNTLNIVQRDPQEWALC